MRPLSGRSRDAPAVDADELRRPRPRFKLIALGVASLAAGSLGFVSLAGVSVTGVTINCLGFCRENSKTPAPAVSATAHRRQRTTPSSVERTRAGKETRSRPQVTGEHHRGAPPTKTTTAVVVVTVVQSSQSPVVARKQISSSTASVKKVTDSGPRIRLRLIAEMDSEGVIPLCATAYDPDGHGVVVIFRPKLGTATAASRSMSQPRLWCATYTAPSTDASEIETVVGTVTDGVDTRSATMRFAVTPMTPRP